MTAAAVTTPSTPSGANGFRLSRLNAAKNATTMKNARTASLIADHDQVRLAVSRTPRDSRNITAITIATAGRFRIPPSSRAVEIDFGQREAERVVEELVEVAAPADGHGRH